MKFNPGQIIERFRSFDIGKVGTNLFGPSKTGHAVALPLFWQTNPALDQSFVDGLKIFYSRTPFYEGRHQPFICSADIDQLLQEAAGTKETDWAVIIAFGNLFSSQFQIVKAVENFIANIQEEVLVCGHLMNKPGFYCGLHEQFLLVNLRTYEKLGKPKFGNYEKATQMLHRYEAGESIHDNYTPRFLKPLEGQAEYRTKTCGWNFVHASLSAGLRVLNLPEELRAAKVFVYPDDETAKLNRNIKRIHEWEDLENPTQKRALAHLMLKKLGIAPGGGSGPFAFQERKNCLFFFNTESLLPDEEWLGRFSGPLDVYCGPCSGFQDLAFLARFGFHDKTKIIHYDISPEAVQFKDFIFREFDGDPQELEGLLTQIRNRFSGEIYSGIVDMKIEELLKIFNGDVEKMKETWNRIRVLPRHGLKTNLLNGGEELFSHFGKTEKIIFNVSDIFLAQNELLYGYDGMLKKMSAFTEKGAQFENLAITGRSLSQTRFLELAKKIDAKAI